MDEKARHPPDIEYKDVKIDLSLKEWVILGIVAIIIARIIYS